jgi:succinate dehydrogenase / fumarate reductase, flavoprotein subunit
VQEFDVVIAGGGATGLRAAIAAKRAGASVALLTKIHPLRSNSGLACGGLNAPLGRDDSAAAFAEDIMLAGDGINDRGVVRAFTESARDDVIWLEKMGAPFNRDSDGRLDRRSLGANRHQRACYADDWTGHIVLQVLYEQFQRSGVAMFDDTFVTSLTVEGSQCIGLTALGLKAGQLDSFSARAVVLATGGFTQLYQPSTASNGTTGDGQSLACTAGARLMDMEMVQFHPTVFPGRYALMITEAALAEGAQIVNQKGEQVVQSNGMSREKLCLAIRNALQNGGGPIMLDLRPIGKDKLAARFAQTSELVKAAAGLDIAKDPIPIAPAAHRPIGGIETNARGETSIPGLFAAGECACNGLNGAGRLAGNILTEAVVFGRTAGEAAAAYAKSSQKKPFPTSRLSDEEKRLSALAGDSSANAGDSLGKVQADLGQLMSERAGLVRDANSLQGALDGIRGLRERYAKLRVRTASMVFNYDLVSCLETGALLNMAEAVTAAAQARKESRGAHNRTDFTAHDDTNCKCHTIVSLAQGALQVATKPLAV